MRGPPPLKFHRKDLAPHVHFAHLALVREALHQNFLQIALAVIFFCNVINPT